MFIWKLKESYRLIIHLLSKSEHMAGMLILISLIPFIILMNMLLTPGCYNFEDKTYGIDYGKRKVIKDLVIYEKN